MSELRCPGCAHRFHFFRKRLAEHNDMTDAQMYRLQQRASASDSRHYTPGTLYGQLAWLNKKHLYFWRWLFFLVAWGGVALYLLKLPSLRPFIFFHFWLGLGGFFFLLFKLLINVTFTLRPDWARFQGQATSWNQSSSLAGNKMINPAKHQLAAPPQGADEDDLFDYGVERVVIVDRDHLVDLLVLNREHVRFKAMIIAQSGYPKYMHKSLSRVLKEQPDVPLILLHGITGTTEAKETAQKMVDALAEKTGIELDAHRTQDLGFHPHHLQKAPTRHLRLIFKTTGFVEADMFPYRALRSICNLNTDSFFSDGGSDGSDVGDISDFG